MGVGGLTTYVETRSEFFYEPYVLHDTTLIIDGWSISSQLYCLFSRCNCAFGGDYDRFDYCVANFFKDLIHCNIKPIVLLDGGWEEKKLSTHFARYKNSLANAASYGVSNQKNKFFPMFCGQVFVDVMERMDIQYAMCIYEADDAVASLAKVLNRPVLSYDSDFYIYGVDYIPFSTLDPYKIKFGNGYGKRCKIFRPTKLAQKFPGLQMCLLPLIAVLSGNDFIDRRTFRDFVSRLRISKSKMINCQQKRIQAILMWLKNCSSLNSAIATILKTIPENRRAKTLESIELMVNSYSNPTIDILRHMGFDEEFIQKAEENWTVFKFSGDINNLDDFEDLYKLESENESSEDEDAEVIDENSTHYDDEIEDNEETNGIEKLESAQCVTSFPEWFMRDFFSGKLPPYFINIITHRIYKLPLQIEDHSYPMAHNICLSIISAIFSVLTTSSPNENPEEVRVLLRIKNHASYASLIVPKLSVPLKDIRSLEFSHRKKLLDEFLEIPADNRLDDVPDSWKLYVASVIYWMRHNDEITKTKIHLDALLVAMLMGIIDQNLRFIRSKETFELKYKFRYHKALNESQARRKDAMELEKGTLDRLVSEITREDCMTAAPFFMEHYSINEKLHLDPKKFSVTIVHVYAEFQSCLRHSMHLNRLLGDVYKNPVLRDFYNGTLIYNLFENFASRADVSKYIAQRLHHSPMLLTVFFKLREIVVNVIGIDIPDGLKSHRRRRRRRRKLPGENNDDFHSAKSDDNDQESYHDPSNMFSLLSIA